MAEMLKPEERKRLIQQKFNKTLEQIKNFLKEEIKKIRSDFSKRGILHSGSYICKVMEIKTNTIKKAVNERIAIEKEILQKEEKELTEEAEQELKAEIKEFIENRLKYLHQQEVEMLKKIRILSGDRLLNMINNDEMIKLTMYANREIDIMKNEIKLSKSTTHSPIVINISKSQIGTFNLGDIIGDIQSQVNTIANSGNKEVAEAIKSLTESIDKSSKSDEEKKILFELLVKLSAQAILPESKRGNSVIKTIFKKIQSALSTSTHLVQIWEVWGKVLLNFFKIS